MTCYDSYTCILCINFVPLRTLGLLVHYKFPPALFNVWFHIQSTFTFTFCCTQKHTTSYISKHEQYGHTCVEHLDLHHVWNGTSRGCMHCAFAWPLTGNRSYSFFNFLPKWIRNSYAEHKSPEVFGFHATGTTKSKAKAGVNPPSLFFCSLPASPPIRILNPRTFLP